MKNAVAKFQEDEPPARVETLAIDEITCDPEIQAREINFNVVLEYAEEMAAGDQFPPVLVMRDGTVNWLVDGLQRFEAARRRGVKTIRCGVRKGNRRAALLASVGVNATHGQRRSTADKRRAVLKLLTDPEWSKWSARAIARQCRVSPMLIADMQAERVAERVTVRTDSEKPREAVLYTTKHGTVSSMNVTAIGRPERPQDIAEEAAIHLAMQRRSYFRETIARLVWFEDHGVLDDDPSVAVEVLMNLDRRDGLARVRRAVAFIQSALDKIGPHSAEVLPFSTD
jgi:hypothetical protein